jgi:hypothetical protein
LRLSDVMSLSLNSCAMAAVVLNAGRCSLAVGLNCSFNEVCRGRKIRIDCMKLLGEVCVELQFACSSMMRTNGGVRNPDRGGC